MDLEVDLDALDALKELLDRAAEDTDAIRKYWSDNGGIDFLGEGLVNLVSDTDDAIESDVNTYLSNLADQTMPGTAEAVGATAVYYRTTETATAATFDKTLPAVNAIEAAESVPSNTYDPYSRPTGFSDIVEPTSALTTVPNFGIEMPYTPTWYDIASPTSLLRDAIWAATELGVTLGICDRTYDIFEVVLKPTVGDWAGMAATGYTMTRVADALGKVDANLDWAVQSTYTTWTGNAADEAVSHFCRIRQSLAEAQTSLVELGNEYTSAATAAYDFRVTIGTILSDVTDAAVAAAAAAAASGALTASGAGLPVALALGAFSLTRVYKVIAAVYAMVKVVGDLRARVDAFDAAGKSAEGGFGSIEGSFAAKALPDTPTLPR